jgi:hypothetical protein
MSTVFDNAIRAAIDSAQQNSTTLRFGDITAITGNKITVSVAGELIPNIPILASAQPKVGSRAWLLHQGPLMVCIGTTAE